MAFPVIGDGLAHTWPEIWWGGLASLRYERYDIGASPLLHRSMRIGRPSGKR